MIASFLGIGKTSGRTRSGGTSLFDPAIVRAALWNSVRKLDPRTLMRNPVMFVVEIVAVVTTLLLVRECIHSTGQGRWFIGQIGAWLWFTVLFANFAEAMAEGRGKAQADSLRQTQCDTVAKLLVNPASAEDRRCTAIAATRLTKGDVVLVEAGDLIPGDGDVIEGIASVDESAITGESAPVIRESGGDRSAVTGGTKVLSDWIKVKITTQPGDSFLDRMIALVEGARRQKTPNELALSILLVGLTIIFLLATATIEPFAMYARGTVPVTMLIALLVTLIPTTIGGLLSAIGIAGMDRLVQHNVLAMSGRAVEAAGDVDTLLLDKTGTITLGNRQADRFIPTPGVTEHQLADVTQLASLADETPEGRSIVVYAKERFGLRARDVAELQGAFVPFSANTRMSGINMPLCQIRKGAAESIERWVVEQGGVFPADVSIGRLTKSPGRAARRSWSLRTVRSWGPSISRTSSRAACANDSPKCGAWAFAR